MRITSFILGLLASASLMAAAHTPNYPSATFVSEYHHLYLECESRFPAQTINFDRATAMAREDCFVTAVRESLFFLPPDTPDRLASAIFAVPQYAPATLKTALDLGIDPYYGFSLASHIQPHAADVFFQIAVLAGADPSSSAAATAAGKKEP